MNLVKPNENDDISCHLQQLGMGTLLCRAAKQNGNNTTNEVSPEICFNCETGKIYREIGCDASSPQIRIFNGAIPDFGDIFCSRKKRYTKLDNCKECNLAQAETTKHSISHTRGIFQTYGFHSAYKDIEQARISFRDGNYENTITRSISSLESVIKIIHEKREAELPNKKQLTDLWKSVRQLLKLSEIVEETDISALLNSLSGTVQHLASLRNSLSDSHGRGNSSSPSSEDLAELAINASSTLSTFVIRRHIKYQELENE